MEKKAVFFVIVSLIARAAWAQDGADALAAEALFFSSSPRQRVSASLAVELGAEKKTRDLEISLMSGVGSYKLLAQVVSPAFLRSMKVLLVSESGRYDTWIKTSQGVKRLGSSSRGESLFQSDFLTSDFQIPDGAWSIIQEGLDGLWVLERMGEARDDFAMQRLYIRAAGKIVARREYLDGSGNVLRAFVVTSWIDDAEGSRPERIELQKANGKGRSTLTITGIISDIDFPAGLFLPGGL